MEDISILKLSINAPPVKPGEFHGERIAKNDLSIHELSWAPHFRRLLHNRECSHPFDLDGFEFQSVEHAFQDYKYRVVYPEEPGVFSTCGKFGKSPLDTITAMMSPSRFKMTRDQFNYWNSIKVDVQYNASIAQLNTWPFKLSALKATGRAHLYGVLLGKETSRDFRMYWLEAIRDNIDLDEYEEHFSTVNAAADLFVTPTITYSEMVTSSKPKEIAPPQPPAQTDEELAQALQKEEDELAAQQYKKKQPPVKEKAAPVKAPAKPPVQEPAAPPPAKPVENLPPTQEQSEPVVKPDAHTICHICHAKSAKDDPLEEKDGKL